MMTLPLRQSCEHYRTQIIDFSRFLAKVPDDNLVTVALKVAMLVPMVLSFVGLYLIESALLIMEKSVNCISHQVDYFYQKTFSIGDLEAHLFSKVLDCPSISLHSDLAFFGSALKEAFGFAENRGAVYKELIINGGVLDEGDAPIEIFQWSAAALVIHYLRTASLENLRETKYLRLYPSSRYGNPLTAISKQVQELEPGERAKLFISILAPEKKRFVLKENTLEIKRLIDGQAIEISRDQHFNSHILRPTARLLK